MKQNRNQGKKAAAKKKAAPKSSGSADSSALTEIKKTIKSVAQPFTKNNRDTTNISFGNEANFAMQIIEKNEYLQKCDVQSIRDAVMNIAGTGLSLNPALKHAYLVPMQVDLPGYGKTWMCHLWPSYFGLQYLATSTGAVSHIEAELHCKNDHFEMVSGTEKKIIHKFDPSKNRGEPIGVYCITTLHNGAKLYEYMTKEQVEQVREHSKMKNGIPWTKYADQQWKKTVIRRASKYWPSVNPGVATALQAMDKVDPMDFGDEKKAEEEEQAVVLSDDDIKSLREMFKGTDIKGEKIDKWLEKLAKSEGYERIEDVPLSRMASMTERLSSALKKPKAD